MAHAERLQEFGHWTGQHITGAEKGQAQIFLDRLGRLTIRGDAFGKVVLTASS